MAAGSWIRFLIGLGLALESIRLWTGGLSSNIALVLAILYLIFTAAFFIYRT
ncbi:MAG: hypothetical protein J4431_02490 [Candidatus Aenigmarchaeota archaeon]|nr:hypothetical protein [Candidatus Aenigmarchaeota archaeon]